MYTNKDSRDNKVHVHVTYPYIFLLKYHYLKRCRDVLDFIIPTAIPTLFYNFIVFYNM